jgi:hypothetical protein
MEFLNFLRLQWDRVLAWVAAIMAAVSLLLGYEGISKTPHVAEQLPYFISGGLIGIFFLGLGGMLWVSADMRDEWRELHAIRVAVEHRNSGEGASPNSNGDFASSLGDEAGDEESAHESGGAARNGGAARRQRPLRVDRSR